MRFADPARQTDGKTVLASALIATADDT